MIKIGSKVSFDTKDPLVGYVVKIEIDPIEECEVNFEATESVFYTIRVYKKFYKYGYADFVRSENDLTLVEQAEAY